MLSSDQAYKNVLESMKAALVWCLRQTKWIAVLALICGLGLIIWNGYLKEKLNRKVIIYTGSHDGQSQSHDYGRTIQSHFQNRSIWSMVHYDVELRTSAGLVENRRRVEESDPGEIAIGFDQDGFVNPASPTKVQTLVPLSDMYLHVIARADELKQKPLLNLRQLIEAKTKAQADGKGKEPAPRGFRCYLGLKGSGTRLIAETVIWNLKLEPAAVDVGDYMGWDQALEQLKRGEIDVVFQGDDIDTKKVKADEKFVLIGLDMTDGLVASNRTSGLQVGKIPRGTYPSKDNAFNPEDVQTVYVRRLITCTGSLTEYDAFHLAEGIGQCLPQLDIRNRYNKSIKAVDTDPLLVQIHPGANDFRNGNDSGFIRVLRGKWEYALSFAGALLFFLIRRYGWFAPKDELPTIKTIGAQTAQIGGKKLVIKVNIVDPKSTPEHLSLTARSSDETVLPSRRIHILGTGGERMIHIRPGANSKQGTTNITLEVKNSLGGTGKTVFDLAVTGPVATPTVKSIPAQSVASETPTLPAGSRYNPKLENANDEAADLAGRVQDLRDGGDAGDIQLLLTKVAKAKRKLGELRLELPTEFRDDLKNLSIKLNAIESDLRKRHRDSASTETSEVVPTKPEVDAGS